MIIQKCAQRWSARPFPQQRVTAASGGFRPFRSANGGVAPIPGIRGDGRRRASSTLSGSFASARSSAGPCTEVFGRATSDAAPEATHCWRFYKTVTRNRSAVVSSSKQERTAGGARPEAQQARSATGTRTAAEGGGGPAADHLHLHLAQPCEGNGKKIDFKIVNRAGLSLLGATSLSKTAKAG